MIGGVLLVPEVDEGIRVEFRDRDCAWRTERVVGRNGNWITVESGLGQRTRIHATWLTGYWPPRVRATTENKVRLEKMTRWQPTKKNKRSKERRR